MYETTAYMLVNGRITHKNSKYQKKGDITQHDIAKVSMYCWVMSPFFLIFSVFMSNAAVN